MSTASRWRPDKAVRGADKMATAKHQAAEVKKAKLVADQNKYFGEAPDNPRIYQTRLVLPTSDMLPNELSRLDDIRLSKEMWITKVKANVIDLRTYSLANMKEGLKKINWVIHDMRLSSNHPMTRFFVQEPIKAGPEALIKFKVRSRPIINNTDLVSSSIYMALESHVCQLGSLLVPASDNLMALDKYLRMRVNFGSLDVRQKKKGIGEEFTYDKFADVIKVYSLRGGASLNPQLPNYSEAEIAIQTLTDPEKGILDEGNHIYYGCNLTIVVDQGKLHSEIVATGHDIRTGMLSMTTTEEWPRLNWTVSAPDMAYDWNLTVEAGGSVDDIPNSLRALVRDIQVKYAVGNGPHSLKFPTLKMPPIRSSDIAISEICLQKTACIPYKDTTWVVEVSVTQVWQGAGTMEVPTTHWGIQVYGPHWEESINYTRVGELRKDWGVDLVDVWPETADAQSLEDRLGAFVQSVLEIQTALEPVGNRKEEQVEEEEDLLL